MGAFNELNRPQHCASLGSIAATTTLLLFHATKKVVVRQADLVAVAAIAGSSTNNYSFQVKKLDSAGTETDIGSAVTTVAGVSKGAVLNLPGLEDYTLDTGESLIVTATLTGTLTISGFLAMDYEVIGN